MTMNHYTLRRALLFTMTLLLTACATTPPEPSASHIRPQQVPAGSIPAPVSRAPLLPPPQPAAPVETYSVSVTNVPVKEVLFALARDAGIDIDIHPDISGQVTINAIDKTLPRIMDRIAAQANLRYEFSNSNLVVSPDRPYLHWYKVNYVNMSRDNNSNVSVATQIATTGQTDDDQSGSGGGSAGGAAGNNNSTTSVQSVSNHRFWETLEKNIQSIVEAPAGEDGSDAVIVNAESGVVAVRATAAQHARVQAFIDEVLTSAQRQVLIEATVVEVELNDDYQFGVDWSRLAENGRGLTYNQSLLGTNLSSPPFFLLDYRNQDSEVGNIAASVRMLQEFGNVKVLSSPKIMAINNQTALLKVVDNVVYFTTEADTTSNETTSITTFTTTLHTVPVGFVMSVTPQIDEDNVVILNVRPTISRITGFVNDPNPALAAEDVESRVPQIQVREMESVLRVPGGQIAVLGGLIQDSVDLNDSGIPYLSKLPAVGNAFAFRDHKIKKSELVIFLRPRTAPRDFRGDELAGDLLKDRRALAGIPTS